MKKHLIPLLIIVLLGLTGLLLYVSAEMYNMSLFAGSGQVMAETALVVAALVPCLYGPAVALLIPLHRRKGGTPRGYSWLGIAAFCVAMIGLVLTTVGHFTVILADIEPWLFLSWAVGGLLLPFFVSSVAHLKEPVPQKTPEERKQTLKKTMTALLVCLCAVLLTGSGLYLRKMSRPHRMGVRQAETMYQDFQKMIAADYRWESIDRVTYRSAVGKDSDGEEKVLAGEEREAAVRLCREMIRPVAEQEETYMGTVIPSQKAKLLMVYQRADVTVDGETYHVSFSSMTSYPRTGAEEVQVVYTQGKTEHTVTLFWNPEPEE